MGINNFLYVLFILASIFLYIEKKEIVVEVSNQEKPAVSFYDSIMYDITKVNINQMIQSSQAYIYDNREELVDGLIINKVKKKNQNDTGINMLKANYLVKVDNDVFLDGDVHLQLNNSIDLKTEQLEYNMETLIAKNSIAFNMVRNDSTFIGDHLYLDAKNNHIIAKNTKIKIKVLDNEKQ